MNTKYKIKKKISIKNSIPAKLSRGKKHLITASALFVLAIAVLGNSSFFSAMMAGTITGTVFQDFNGNGTFDTTGGTADAPTAVDAGVAGIIVTAYDSAGAVQGSATTLANGTYSLSATGTGPYRLEFTNLPAGYKPSARSTDSVAGGTATNSGSTVQFVADGNTANVNLGINRPEEYCQNNPNLVTCRFNQGAQNGTFANNPAVQRFTYDSGTVYTDATAANYDAPAATTIAPASSVGSLYGLAYRRSTQRIYASAYYRRYAGFGPGANGTFDASPSTTSDDSSAIYVLNPANGAVVSTFTVPNAATNSHSNAAAADTTNASWDAVGKTSLGGIALADDESSLFVMNLQNRTLYSLNPTTGASTDSQLVPTPATCPTATDVRPFALKYYRGNLYVGMVCSAESTGSAANLRAYVYQVNPATLDFGTTPYTFSLNYNRGANEPAQGATTFPDEWRPWVATTQNTFVYAQPMLTDIEFDNGNMVLGLRDRVGDQGQDLGPTAGFRPAGDVLRSCGAFTEANFPGTLTLEANGRCGATGSAPQNTGQGPGAAPGTAAGSGEFYFQDDYSNPANSVSYHDEVLSGGLLKLPGYGQTLTTVFDPLSRISVAGDQTFDQGVRWLNNATGGTTKAYRILNGDGQTSTGGEFGKANGLGDIIPLCDSAPIEVGNRVWIDADGDGIQDPQTLTETGRQNVTVELYTGDLNGDGDILDANENTLVGTTTTDANGEWYFNNANITDGDPTTAGNQPGLRINTNYIARIGTADFTGGVGVGDLAGLVTTKSNITTLLGTETAGANNTDSRDSDAAVTGGRAEISFNSSAAGSNNHTLDFGFVAPVSIGSTVFNDANNNGLFDAGETGISGVSVELLYDANNDGVISGAELTAIATTTTSAVAGSVGNYFFGNLTPGNYQIRIPTPPTGLELSSINTDTADNQQDNDDNGTQAGGAGGSTISPIINLTPGAEPLNAVETGQGGTLDDATTDANGDMTVDFGFVVPTYSLGNRVWFDTNNDGQINAGEVGISGVSLTLLDSANNPVDNPNLPGTQNYTITTDANGYYRFDTLSAGNYKVRVDSANFAAAAVLTGYQNTTGNTAADLDSTTTAGQNGEDGINPGGAANTVQTSGILSNLITLGAFAEPLGEADVQASGQGTVDNLANMTVDFGFYRLNLSGTVWLDTGAGANNDNGILDAGEARMPNAVVLLYDSAGVEIPVGYDGILGTADDTVGGMQTDASGNYNFQGLPPGTYRVGVNTARTGTSSTPTAANTDANIDNDDDGGVNASFPQRVVSGLITLTPGGEPSVTNATGTTLNTTVDFGFVVAPTLVKLDTFNAYSDGDSVTVKWETASEDSNLGFNVYREAGGKRELLNASPVIGTALRSKINLEAKSAGYSWTDIQPVNNAVYYLEDIDMKGGRTMHGPVTPIANYSGEKTSNSKLLSDLRKLAGESKQTDSLAESGKSAARKADNSVIDRRQFEIAAREGVKIAVKRDGWYRVSVSELQNAGFDVASDPNKWQMFADGEEIPFRFGAENSVEFYGHGLDLLETDKQIYYLIVGATNGQRLPDEQAAEVEKRNDAASFRNTAAIKDRTIYLVGVLNGDEGNWFGALVYQGASAEYDLAVSNRYDGGQAHLKVKLQGLSDFGHAVNLRFNDLDLGALNFEGYNNRSFEFDVPMSAVVEGNNRITMSGIGDSDDLISVDEVALTYERKFTDSNDRLTFRVPAGNTVEVGGFSDADISVVEISNGRAVRRLSVQPKQTNGGFAFNLSAADYDREFIALTDSQTSASASIVRNNPSRWNSAKNNGQFIIIAPERFYGAASNLAQIRQQEGLETVVVPVEDIYDEFNFGAPSVASIKEFLRLASRTWQITPKFVLMFGDASYDMRNYLAQPDRNLVPTKLVDTHVFETSSDAWITDFDDDGIEDISIGRLPVGTETEAAQMVEKITRRQQTESVREQKSNLFVADGGFDASADELRETLPANVASGVIRRSELGVAQMRGEIIGQTNNGHSVITYVGHGSSVAWSSGGFFRTTDTTGLKNDKLSFYLLMTCLNGYAIDPGSDSLAEALMKSQNGAFAVWVSSGATHVGGQAEISRAATDLIFKRETKPLRIGDIARLAKSATQDAEIRKTWQLIGDPTMFVK